MRLPTRTPTRLQAIDLEFAACGHGTLGLHHQLGFDVGGASDVVEAQRQRRARRNRAASSLAPLALRTPVHRFGKDRGSLDRKSVVWGKSGSVRVDLGGRRTI